MSPGVAERERCQASLVAVLMVVVQEVAGSCCAASFCREKWLLLLGVAQLLLHCIKLRSENREGSHVSIPERMVSCRLLLVHVRNNVLVLFGTLKVQSFMLTEVIDCDLLIVVTSSTFLKRKDMLKEQSS